MKTLIVFGSPNEKGYCASILNSVLKELNARRLSYSIIRLNDERFDPVLHPDQFEDDGTIKPDNHTKRYQKLLKDCDRYIFIYPVWWNMMPAMMKGFFDKTFTARFAFRFWKIPVLGIGMPRPLLNGKKATVIITTGAPVWASFIGQGNRFKTFIKHDILGTCGVRAKIYQLGDCRHFKKERMPEIERLVNKGINSLFS